MELDPDGWLDIDALIENANARGTAISLEVLHQVVATNDKRRFSLSEDGLRIRANQGHSIAGVDLNLSPIKPPLTLFHGTVSQFIPGIRRRGLLKRSRNHVHLSADRTTATEVGRRRGVPIVLLVDSQAMEAAGYSFYLSANDVWLTDEVPLPFITFP